MASGSDSLTGAGAARKRGVLRQPFTIGSQEILISTSIGIAIHPTDGQDVDTLIHNADMAMYEAKGRGRRTYRRYRPALRGGAR